MIGLMFILAFGIYLAISVWVIKATVAWAKRTGRGVKRWGFIAAFVMYLLVFWDHIPTLLLYKYYCATKAGLWVYKTPEQWKKENPAVAETLTWHEHSPVFTSPGITRGYQLNERFAWTHKVIEAPLLPVRLDKESIIDIKKDEIVLEQVSIGAGYVGAFQMLRFWTSLEPCIKNQKQFDHYWKQFKQMGREIK